MIPQKRSTAPLTRSQGRLGAQVKMVRKDLSARQDGFQASNQFVSSLLLKGGIATPVPTAYPIPFNVNYYNHYNDKLN